MTRRANSGGTAPRVTTRSDSPTRLFLSSITCVQTVHEGAVLGRIQSRWPFDDWKDQPGQIANNFPTSRIAFITRSASTRQQAKRLPEEPCDHGRNLFVQPSI